MWRFHLCLLQEIVRFKGRFFSFLFNFFFLFIFRGWLRSCRVLSSSWTRFTSSGCWGLLGSSWSFCGGLLWWRKFFFLLTAWIRVFFVILRSNQICSDFFEGTLSHIFVTHICIEFSYLRHFELRYIELRLRINSSLLSWRLGRCFTSRCFSSSFSLLSFLSFLFRFPVLKRLSF